MTESRHDISNNVVCATSKASDQPVHTRSLISAFASGLNIYVELLTEHHFEFLTSKGGCSCSSEYTHVKMPHCWKSHAMAHIRAGVNHDSEVDSVLKQHRSDVDFVGILFF